MKEGNREQGAGGKVRSFHRVFPWERAIVVVFAFVCAACVFAQNAGIKKILTVDSYTTQDKFNNPQGIFYDKKRNRLFVADTNNHRVAVLTRDGLPVTQLGVQKELEFPADVIVSSRGAVYVMEQTTHRVKKYSPGFQYGGVVDFQRLVDAEKQKDKTTDVQAKVDSVVPLSIAMDAKDNLYVLSKNQKIYAFLKDEAFQFSFGGKGKEENELLGAVNVTANGGGMLYVLDAGRSQGLVRIFDKKGELTGAFGKKGEGFQDLMSPVSLSLDEKERVWIADDGCQCFKVFEKNSLYLFTIGGAESENSFFYPRRAAFDSFGKVFVLEQGSAVVGIYEMPGNLSP